MTDWPDIMSCLPQGYQAEHLKSVDSTNSEVLRRAEAGAPAGLWITADEQARGRGRMGREWASPCGNLYASLLVRPSCPLAKVGPLSLLAGIAAFDTAAHLLTGAPCDAKIAAPPLTAAHPLWLKWPNDLMTGPAKLGGVLLESIATQAGQALVIGVGLNLTRAPDLPDRATAQLSGQGPGATPADAFSSLAQIMARWLDIWREGEGLEAVRQAWLARAGGLGAPLAVQCGAHRLRGKFTGIDADGALQLRLPSGKIRQIAAGEIIEMQGCLSLPSEPSLPASPPAGKAPATPSSSALERTVHGG